MHVLLESVMIASMFFRYVTDTNQSNRTVGISNSTPPENIWGLGGLEEDHQLRHCCWSGRVGEREEEDWKVLVHRNTTTARTATQLPCLTIYKLWG